MPRYLGQSAIWSIEKDSNFPDPYSKLNGNRCRSIHSSNFNMLIPNIRQSISSTTTVEGLWMVGGLISPSTVTVMQNL